MEEGEEYDCLDGRKDLCHSIDQLNSMYLSGNISFVNFDSQYKSFEIEINLPSGPPFYTSHPYFFSPEIFNR